MAISELETPLERVLLEHGARIVVRHGHRVAADFGSVASEMAVCQRSVGLADRFGRVTLDVRGAQDAVAAALARLEALAGRARAVRRGPNRAVVRCEPSDEEACRVALDGEDVLVRETTAEYAALGLVGPHARDVLRDACLDEEPFGASVLSEDDGFEILVPRTLGADVWAQLFRSGAPFGIACVGFDALEHLAVARHLAEL
jgi:glycine cleavage system aminomethyltransferase T